MKSFGEIHDILMQEHQDKYDKFTRLILSLSAAFITFTLALSQGNTELNFIYKLAVVLNGFSLVIGIWLQFILIKNPLDDLMRLAEIFQSSEKLQSGKTEYFSRPPSYLQLICFHLQIGSFLLSFTLLVVSIFL